MTRGATAQHTCLENEHLRGWWNSGKKCSSGGEAALKHLKKQKGEEHRLQVKVFHLGSSETLCVRLETLEGLASNRQTLQMAGEEGGEVKRGRRFNTGKVEERTCENKTDLLGKVWKSAHFSKFQLLLTLKPFILCIIHPEPQVLHFLVPSLRRGGLTLLLQPGAGVWGEREGEEQSIFHSDYSLHGVLRNPSTQHSNIQQHGRS